MRLLTYDFAQHDVDVVRDEDGSVVTYVHDLPEGRRRNRHGAGPFATIVLGTRLPAAKGVYAVTVDREVVYVGRAESMTLGARWGSSQYAAIQPYNTFTNGQSTNCRINTLIWQALAAGCRVELWTHVTERPGQVEIELERAIRPPWNIRRL